MEIRTYKSRSGNGYYTTAKDTQKNLKKYIPVQFKKGTEPTDDSVDIEIKNAFFGVYNDHNNIGQIKLVVMEYTVKDSSNFNNNEEQSFTDTSNVELPF